ncbi:class II aldolase/adducin family protein [Ralstonia pickettii]|nr:class II aldolase/adducin family protein [Ralstonia pickettii]MBC9968380.1 class II aldolase/adducin family protein [Ralstonia insidiosa]MBA9889278.1 class II aldolase/adducin family protein [Ralstonia pickettii]MBA9893809.1 class II aldolase/adducin family protein [Ralstonia pickettii]MBA9925862.1 class II aldolase/adducin family protein [Ralstonia pickettii]
MTLEEAQQKLIDAGLILETNGQGDFTRGHVSVRMPGDPSKFIMKPHSYGFDEITPENIVVCNIDGEKIGGGGRRHSEVFIHSEIYKARPDITSVIHTHPIHAVALSATGKSLKMISQPACTFADGVPYYTDTVNLIRTQDMGRGVAQALGNSKAVLMRNHGVAVAGGTIEEAVILALALDEACHIQLLTEAAGGEGEVFSDEDVQRLHDQVTRPEQFTINFDYLRRKVQRARG